MNSLRSAIYKIQYNATARVYIGSTSNLVERWKRHKKDLRNNNHHSTFLQRAWNKYGESAFTFSVICWYEPNDLIWLEDRFLATIKPVFNMCPKASSNAGRVASDQERQDKREYAQQHGIRPPKETWEQKRKCVSMICPKTGNVLHEFASVSDACRFMGKDHRWVTMISGCADNKPHRKTAWGYIWRWTD